ncbi:Zn-dependent hydrolase [Bradyrhizobium sp. CSA207]|uniref:Zn-dependent hydrolase n=1 Tax=Bradyrhizobium sp. CSA207 TaxID=2698826 RepID=UPI0023B1E6BF|nr:Zn-dependent hydrolase [Bradyrhizobium sp. CSA207]MDE5445747.1 Zn-dependent hydrolase [Bradyrhizobium sp. CSA207]
MDQDSSQRKLPPSQNRSVDADRLWQDLMALGTITDPGRPYTRRCFTHRFVEGRRWLANRFSEAGLAVRLDTGANMIGRMQGRDPSLPALLIGSHSDTVPSGGRFDGMLGVLAGLEVIRMLRDRGIVPRHPIEIVDFLGEEPSDYGLSCIGSRAMSGLLNDPMLDFKNASGETLAAAMARMGAEPSALAGARRSDIAAYLELHIEQGRVLESGGTNVGLVTGIVGIARIEIEFTGAADHAGTTPFHLRRDTLIAASEIVTAVRRIGESYAVRNEGYFIATTGCLDIEPNASNVVPARARLVVEGRAENGSWLSEFTDELDALSRSAAKAANVERSAFRLISLSEPAPCDARVHRHLVAAAAELELSTADMASGAGHDAAFMAQIAPAAMVFVPSRDGRSHCPEEWTAAEDCSNGAALLFEALLRIDADDAFLQCARPVTGARGVTS